MKSIFTFFLDEKSNKKIKPEYFYPKNHQTDFPIATPAVRAAHSTPGSLPYGQRANPYRDFLDKNIRAVQKTFL
jgi:hypothetical protein